MRLFSLRSVALALAVVLVGGGARAASAQSAGNGYLFHSPEGRFTVRGGYALATAQSDLFDFTVKELTLSRRDFSGLTLGAEFGVPVADRWELTIDLAFSRASKLSSFRHYIDNNDAEIEQTTTFDRLPLTGNVRYYLTAPGRSIGKLAWVPSQIVPWVGAGGGVMYYRFKQDGDFVDFKTFNVFRSDFISDSWSPAAQVLGGFDFTLSPQLAITTDARYIWSKGTLKSDFSGFNRIDLSGASATVGLTVRM